MKHILLVVALVALVPSLTAQAPAGYVTWVDKETGLTGFLPKEYRQIPLVPTEKVMRAKLIRKTPPAQLERLRARPQIHIFLFKKSGGGTTLSPASAKPGEKKKPGEGERAEQPGSYREMMEMRGEVGSFEELQKKRLSRWTLSPVKKKENRFELRPKSPMNNGRNAQRGYLILKEQGATVFGIFGVSWEPHAKSMRRRVERIARSLKLPEGDKATAAADKVERELDRIYRNKSYRHIENRKTVRKNLARGWKARDSDNYILVYHTKNTKLINRIAKNIEAMNAYYTKLFPPAREISAVSVVRICRNQGEYLQYGGRPGTGGYWHPGNEELVFYDYKQSHQDAERTGQKIRRRRSDRDSLLVLYHEAFHQFIYYAVGQVAPHDWFNEGNGDFFSGAVIPGTSRQVKRVQPSWWRIHRAKDQMEHGKGRKSLEKLLKASRATYYNRSQVSDWYAAGWSFVYFMRTSPKVAKHSQWSGLLDKYFEELKTAYGEAIELRGGGDASLGDKQMAQAQAKKKAIEAMLEGVDLPALEKEWERYIIKLRDPWPHLRKKTGR
ncbi:MAG: hypothetical protein CMJ83_10890 [Planctomycetes bacterium]|nr:hypothetical protein [Planctomycetota bacterium]